MLMEATTTAYKQVAWCNPTTPCQPGHFEYLKGFGVESVVVNLGDTDAPAMVTGIAQTLGAKKAGLTVHTAFTSVLRHPEADAMAFADQIISLCLPKITRACLRLAPDMEEYPDVAKRIKDFFIAFSEAGATANIGLILTPSMFHKNPGLQHLAANLHLICEAPDQRDPGDLPATAWIYTGEFEGTQQAMMYDYEDFYGDPKSHVGYEITLDNFYVVRDGDTWWAIANLYGKSVVELLELNNGTGDEYLKPGRRIRVF